MEWPTKIEKVLILVAMPEEAKSIQEQLNMEPDEEFESPFVVCYKTTTASSKQIFLAVFKIDPVYNVPSVSTEPATLAAYVSIMRYDPDVVLSCGTCGGIQSAELPLVQGDVVIPNVCRYIRSIILPQFQPYITGEAYGMLDIRHVDAFRTKLHDIQKGKNCWKVGTLATTNSFVGDDEPGRQAGANVVEMECCAISRVCRLMGKPLTGVKIVSDVECEEETGKSRQEMFNEFIAKGVAELGRVTKEFVEILVDI